MEEENDDFEQEEHQSGALSRIGVDIENDEYTENEEPEPIDMQAVGTNFTTIIRDERVLIPNDIASDIQFSSEFEEQIRRIVSEEVQSRIDSEVSRLFSESIATLESNIQSSMQYGMLNPVINDLIRDYLVRKLQQF